MQSKCRESRLIVMLAAFCTFGPSALSASADNNDGATLPPPVKKSSQASPARSQPGDDRPGDKSKNDMGSPKGDGHNGGMMPPPSASWRWFVNANARFDYSKFD